MVEQQDRKEAVLKAMADPYERKILRSTITIARSIEEISQENCIPVSTCYRRVHELVTLRLLRVEHIIITSSGKKYETFRSTLKGVRINLIGGELLIDVEMNRTPSSEKLKEELDSTIGQILIDNLENKE
jgi:hypothetical protein